LAGGNPVGQCQAREAVRVPCGSIQKCLAENAFRTAGSWVRIFPTGAGAPFGKKRKIGDGFAATVLMFLAVINGRVEKLQGGRS
jgi:hypothetical protein